MELKVIQWNDKLSKYEVVDPPEGTHGFQIVFGRDNVIEITPSNEGPIDSEAIQVRGVSWNLVVRPRAWNTVDISTEQT